MLNIKPILEVKNLCVKHDAGFGIVEIIKNISFNIDSGKVIGITGESGAGKSILALAIMKLTNFEDGFITTGNIFFDEFDLMQTSDKVLCQLRGNEISIVFQNPLSVLNPVIKCGAQILEAIEIHGTGSGVDAKKQILDLLFSVGLKETERFYNAYPYELSGGELQRICIAMAVVNKPKLIIVDEATASLDVLTSKEIISLLMSIKLNSGCSFIFISHDIKMLQNISDTIILIKDGTIIDKVIPSSVDINKLKDYTKSYLSAGIKGQNFLKNVLLDTHPILEVSKLTKNYHTKSIFSINEKSTSSALSDVTFSMTNGSVLGVLGESGSGKSTLAKILCGLITDYSGSIMFNKHKLNGIDKSKNIWNIQMVFQDATSSLNPKLKINTVLREVIYWYNKSMNSADVDLTVLGILEKVSLSEHCLNKYPHQLSGGQKQRICLARTLLAKPQLIIFDESLSALDIFNQQKMMDLILDLQKEMNFSALFISHDANLIKYICTELIVLDVGKIVEQGKMEDVFLHPKHIKTKQLLELSD